MTDYALENLGDIIFIELPEVGNKFKKNEEGIDENRTVTLEYTGPVSKSIVEAYHD